MYSGCPKRTHALACWPLQEESVSVLAWGWVVGYSDEMNFQITKGLITKGNAGYAGACGRARAPRRLARAWRAGVARAAARGASRDD